MKLLRRELKNAALILVGILSMSFGLEGFLASSKVIDGGVTGVSMLLSKVLGFSLPLLIALINIPFIFLGDIQLGRAFAVRSALGIFGLSLALALIHFHNVTDDKLLTAVFGGFFIGAGIGLTIRGNGVLDGTDIAALLVSKRVAFLRVGDVILGLNIVIFLMAAYFLGIDSSLYSILTYFSASKTLDFLLHGIEEYTAITIISGLHCDAIRLGINERLGRGVTIYKGRGGRSNSDQDILYCVVTRLEIGKVKAIVKEVDPSAFLIVSTLVDVEGGVLKRRHQH